MPTQAEITQSRHDIERANVKARRRGNRQQFKDQRAMNRLAIRRHGIEGITNVSTRRDLEKAIANAPDPLTYDVFGVDPTKKLSKRSRTISAGFEHLDSYMMGKGSSTEKFNNTIVRAELTRIRDQLKGTGGAKGELRQEIDAYLEKFPKNRMIKSGQGIGEAQSAVASITQHIQDQFNVDWINEWHGMNLGRAGVSTVGQPPALPKLQPDSLFGPDAPDFETPWYML